MAITQSTDVQDDVDGRDRRALREPMVVVQAAPQLYVVYSGEFDRYRVDLEYPPSCECDDWHYRQPDGGCKHARRVLFTIGRREIPDVAGIDPTLPAQRKRMDE
ncbi:hypothetical protein [Natronoglomus mannanivorans]|uniref:SWIM-type domain-containing protein n=1 Tax=Natronoglomus mannanivorans TaxID=2979990 RepID=A0AAP2Z1E1_9EURY|nr:hypothetical protein [Halobacteria archaeon AArc-xg1-1]